MQKVNWYVLTLTVIFINHKRINICECTVKIVPREFTYIYSLLIEIDLWECWNVSVKIPYALLVYLCHFFSKSFSFLFLFLYYPYFGTFPFHVDINGIQIKLLSGNKLLIWGFGNLHYQISREKFEPEPGLWMSEVRIPIQVQIFLLKSDNINGVFHGQA